MYWVYCYLIFIFRFLTLILHFQSLFFCTHFDHYNLKYPNFWAYVCFFLSAHNLFKNCHLNASIFVFNDTQTTNISKWRVLFDLKLCFILYLCGNRRKNGVNEPRSIIYKDIDKVIHLLKWIFRAGGRLMAFFFGPEKEFKKDQMKNYKYQRMKKKIIINK